MMSPGPEEGYGGIAIAQAYGEWGSGKAFSVVNPLGSITESVSVNCQHKHCDALKFTFSEGEPKDAYWPSELINKSKSKKQRAQKV